MSFILTGLLFMTPEILKGISAIVQAANPTNIQLTEHESIVLCGHYNHMKKKLMYIAKLLNSDMVFEEIGTAADLKKLITDLVNKSHLIMKEYEKFISSTVIKDMIVYYFTNNITDEYSNWNFDPSNSDMRMSSLDLNYFIGAGLMSKLHEFEPYVLNHVYGYDQSKVIMINTMIDDALLAICRIHPSKVVCPTKQFITYPHRFKRWIISSKPETIRSLTTQQTNTITVILSEDTVDIMKKYSKVYNFYLSIVVTMREVGIMRSPAIIVDQAYTIECYYTSNNYLIECKNHTAYNILSIGLFEYEFYGELKSTNLMLSDYQELHSLNHDKLTFGSLLSEGDYTLKDPVFGISNLFSNVIGSAQFSMQTSLIILKRWIDLIIEKNQKIIRQSMMRYPSIDGRLDVSSFSTISNKLIDTKMFQYKSVDILCQYWDRLINDLEFMKKYVLRTIEGVEAIREVFRI